MTLALLLADRAATAQTVTEAQVVERALQQNPTLRAAVLDLRAAQEALTAAEAEFRPSLTVGVDGGHGESLSATQVGIAPNADNSVGLGLGVSYATKVGTTVAVDVDGAWRSREVNRDPSTTSSVDIDGTYDMGATVQVSQALLRGAGRDVGEADIRAAKLSRTAAEHARDQAASELIRDVLTAYWELWYAQEAVTVNQAARELGTQQLADAEDRVSKLGTMARADALRFASELATIEEQLTEAEATQHQRAVELGRLMGLAPNAAIELRAAANPPVDLERNAPSAFVQPSPLLAAESSAAAVLETTKRTSSALQELAAELELARDKIRVAQDATRPRLDLTASFGVGGLWNGDTIRTGELPNDRPALSGQLGLELELPLGNARARAQLAEARLQATAAEARFEAQEQQLESEAMTLLDQLRSASRRASLTQRSVDVARQLAEAEQEALRLGTSTALQVLEAQASLRETELRSLRARVDQSAAIIALNHLTGHLLEAAAIAGPTEGHRP